MACGDSGALTKLKDKLGAAQDALADLQGDIAGQIDQLGAKLNEAAGEIQGAIKEMMPTIELPELPDLPDLKLPELELPELPVIDKLQDRIGGVLEVINDPLALLKIGGPEGLQKELDEIQEKFGDKIPNFDQLREDVLSGKIGLDDLCKKVPNLEIDQANPDSVEEKGTPTTAPTEDAEPVPEPVKTTPDATNQTFDEAIADFNSTALDPVDETEVELVEENLGTPSLELPVSRYPYSNEEEFKAHQDTLIPLYTKYYNDRNSNRQVLNNLIASGATENEINIVTEAYVNAQKLFEQVKADIYPFVKHPIVGDTPERKGYLEW